MTYVIRNTFPNDHLLSSEGLKISIGMVIHHEVSIREHDKIDFKNIFKNVMSQLILLDDGDEKKRLIEKIETLLLDTSLFDYSDQSLLIYIDSEETSIYVLQTLIKTFNLVSHYFQLKPLVAYYQNLKNYHLLALTADAFTLLEGNRYGVKQVSHIDNVSLELMFENQERQNFVTRGSYGGANSKGMFHGHGDTKNIKDIMKLKYFNEVDSLISSFQKEHDEFPVILITSIIHMSDFLSVTKNDLVLKDFIDGNLFDMTLDEVASKINVIDDKASEARIHMEIEQYFNLLDSKQSSDDAVEIKKALGEGRVETLLISSEHMLEILDEYINIGISKGSEVLVLSNNEMPEGKDIIAIFRYI